MRIALDTNVLVRVFIDDASSKSQMEQARELVKKSTEIYIPQIVQAELVWVLNSAYQLQKSQILVVLEKLLSHSIFLLQEPEIFKAALESFNEGKADFSDYLIAESAKSAGFKLFSFDKKLIKTEFAEAL